MTSIRNNPNHKSMKFVSWNVNGLRAVYKKGFSEIFEAEDADFFCLQETKMQEGQLEISYDGYESYWDYAERKGYSGTAIFTRRHPLSVRRGMGVEEHDHEGRIVTLEFEKFFLVNVYVPNSKEGLERLPYRMEWERDFLNYVKGLDSQKPVVICGDLNVAHQEIDLARPATNHMSAGFTDEERTCLSRLLDSGFVDTFRHLNPEAEGVYSWWSYRYGARAKNLGWRIDYFLISERLLPQLRHAAVRCDITGSDHCPVTVELEL